MPRKYTIAFVMLVTLCSQNSHANEAPWRLAQQNLTPDWFVITGQHRSRFETLNNQFRAGRSGGDQALVFRTNIKATVSLDKTRFAAEMMDSRAMLVDTGTPLNTTIVNPLELLQAYVEFPITQAANSTGSTLKGGRITMDVGSRRLVARNRYRNTINAFTGVDLNWRNDNTSHFRAFATLPIQRRVHGNILDNEPRLDKEYNEVKFWGLYYSRSSLPVGERHNGEIYLLGLDEKDVPGELLTRNRELYTLVGRIFTKPTPGTYYYELESAIQFGESRSSTTSTRDLDHFAYFFHLETGYSFNTKWKPQLIFQFDYASGDKDPDDGKNNRFDTLYGARRFEYGPTSVYGAFARSNIITPGVRLKIKPLKTVSSFVALRGFWLASDQDAWTTAGIRNLPGQSDKYIGTQAEARVRWDIKPKNLRLESGAAFLLSGDVMKNANKTDSSYLYSQVVVSF